MLSKISPLAVLLLACTFSPAGCKTTKERTEEQSKTQNVLTDYVKTPQDRARSMKARVESGQNSVAEQAQQAAE